jgi:uncharacterized protein
MAYIGRFNRLSVSKIVDHGVYLDAAPLGEVLLPRRDVPDHCQVGDKLGAFIYLDSEDRLIATTKRPLAQAGEVACLKVIQVNRVGAFMDWGLPKDLLVPFNQQQPAMQEGKSYLVYVHVDEDSNRIIGSSLLNKFISKEPPAYNSGQAVELHVSEKTDLGYACVIDHQYWGLLFYSDVMKPLKLGQHIKGFIKRVREDGKVDLSLQAPGFAKVDDLSRRILRALNENDGFLGLSDKSPPEAIYEKFGISKKSYKMTIGNMLKKKLILIEKDGIRLLKEAD